MDLERMIEGLKHLDAKVLVRLRGKIRLRLQEDWQRAVPSLLEYRPCAAVRLQVEVCRYYREAGIRVAAKYLKF